MREELEGLCNKIPVQQMLLYSFYSFGSFILLIACEDFYFMSFVLLDARCYRPIPHLFIHSDLFLKCCLTSVLVSII